MGFAEAALCCCRRNASSPAQHISSRRHVYLGQLSRAQQRRELHKNRGSLCPCGSLTSAPSPSRPQEFFQRTNDAAPLLQHARRSSSPAWDCQKNEGARGCRRDVGSRLGDTECNRRGSASFGREVGGRSRMEPK